MCVCGKTRAFPQYNTFNSEYNERCRLFGSLFIVLDQHYLILQWLPSFLLIFYFFSLPLSFWRLSKTMTRPNSILTKTYTASIQVGKEGSTTKKGTDDIDIICEGKGEKKKGKSQTVNFLIFLGETPYIIIFLKLWYW